MCLKQKVLKNGTKEWLRQKMPLFLFVYSIVWSACEQPKIEILL